MLAAAEGSVDQRLLSSAALPAARRRFGGSRNAPEKTGRALIFQGSAGAGVAARAMTMTKEVVAAMDRRAENALILYSPFGCTSLRGGHGSTGQRDDVRAIAAHHGGAGRRARYQVMMGAVRAPVCRRRTCTDRGQTQRIARAARATRRKHRRRARDGGERGSAKSTPWWARVAARCWVALRRRRQPRAGGRAGASRITTQKERAAAPSRPRASTASAEEERVGATSRPQKPARMARVSQSQGLYGASRFAGRAPT